ncbi:GDP-L-fucose synthase family protein [Aromatoleum petrolei]|uniref:GDP-L-fucose synthase n=1 Tax=Aromatoleum petrolei TaxID=76116 RepID=A0ABX1MVC2_9RHOO|nr:GDP-L-fucose synthase [Aromatoleum petrolei]NMF90631.1 NAD-dependent epimerase/dehydratase family protein [Aromatoleum petrolei]QTQ35907.1 GDP-L-fucose synthase [Aromatoleum petrolei]
MKANLKVYVAGHRGMVGSAILRQLESTGCGKLVTRTRTELDLTNQAAVGDFFKSERPDLVYLAAAKVGGIHANNVYPAEFIYENLMIEANVIHAAHCSGVQKLLFLGSSCIYPRLATQPMREDALLSGALEATNEPYAIAKIAGIKLCESYNRQYGRDYRSVMPTNLYGPGDNYDLSNSHVLPAMIRKLHLAKLAAQGDVSAIVADEAAHGEIAQDIKAMIGLDPAAPITAESTVRTRPIVTLWGTGTPFREFLHVDDMASASVFVMNLDKEVYDANTHPMLSHINVGFGKDLSIREVAVLVAEIVGYQGQIAFDCSKPDGTPRKLMDSGRLERLGWKAKIDLKQGLEQAYSNYLSKESRR